MEAPPRKLPPKRDVVLALLAKSSVRLFLDPRREAVVVPKGFLKQAELVLRIGYSLSPPIPDLEIGDHTVACTLSFNRSPSWCEIPFEAIYAVISDADGRGVVWPEDVPIESQLLRSPKPARPPSSVEKPKLAALPSSTRPGPKTVARDTSPRGGRRELERGAFAPPSPAPPPEPTLSENSVAGESTSEAPAESAPSEATSASGAKAGKRQLPPYLRVVK
jgi:stringent starvation protein B